MKLKSVVLTVIGLSLAAVIFAQTSQNSSSQSSSKSGNGQSGSSASGHSYSNGSASSNSSKNGSANGSGGGSGSGFGFNGKPTHAIMFSLESNEMSAADRQKAFDQHTKYLSDQQTKGKVLLFGPWRDLPGSMAIVLGPTDEDATNIARNDPAVKSGNLTFEVRAWNVVTPSPTGGVIKN
jgi:uncharacterized protein YciI